MSRKITAFFVFVLASSLLFACGTAPTGTTAPLANQSYEKVPLAKIFVPAIRAEYYGKGVEVSGKYIGICQNDTSAQVINQSLKEYIVIGVASEDAQPILGNQHDTKWYSFYVPKNNDTVFELKEGSIVTIKGRVEQQTMINNAGQEIDAPVLTVLVDNLEASTPSEESTSAAESAEVPAADEAPAEAPEASE